MSSESADHEAGKQKRGQSAKAKQLPKGEARGKEECRKRRSRGRRFRISRR